MVRRPAVTRSLQLLRRVRRLVLVACLGVVAAPTEGPAEEVRAAAVATEKQRTGDLTELPLEALMELEVTSVSKKPQRVADAAAAIYVLTQEDIRRSGATSIAEALRLVPGLYVARIGSNAWAVSARGFTGRYSSQFLVLVDGRAVYTPTFSGVFWEVVDTVLEDIERIEVIRGPGAALWGANAVNGVVNIITKRARDTLGGLATFGAGTEERGFGTLRYGAKQGDVAVRGYLKYFNRDEFVLDTPQHDGAGDAWEIFRSGFRLDADVSARDTVTLIGNWHKGTVSETALVSDLMAPTPVGKEFVNGVEGLDITSRWVRAISQASSLQLQLYYDWLRREDFRIHLSIRTYDADLQYRFPVGTFNDVIVGLGYRHYHLDSTAGQFIGMVPPTADLHLFSAFVQDDVSIVKNVLHLILGTKLEHTTYTGLEWEPNARLLWTPTTGHTLWGAVSRAVRTPSIGERQRTLTFVTPPGPGVPVPTVFVIRPDSQTDGAGSEKLLAYEVGYRTQVRPGLTFDVAAFYHRYTDLILSELQSTTLQPAPVPHVLVASTTKNAFDSEVYGFELLAEFEPFTWWKLRGAYAFLARQDDRRVVTIQTTDANRSPQSVAHVRSLLDLGRGFELDVVARYVGDLPEGNAREYFELDARLGWRSRAVELALVGRNLVHAQHLEYNNVALGPVPVGVQREMLFKATLRF